MAVSTLIIRLPDDRAQRLKVLAKTCGLSINKLVEQLNVHALAATGHVSRALEMLDRLDAEDRYPDR
jgi:predicted DNA-binding protein